MPLPSERWTPAVDAFVDQARLFCAFVERSSGLSLRERLLEARQRLLGLYTAGSVLPVVEPPEGIDASWDRQRAPGWRGFETLEAYWEVFDPYEEDAPVCTVLSDDVLDIYFDVQRGLDLWDRDVPCTAAIWEWRFHFDTHWGDHAIDALRALHRACGQVTAARSW